MPGDYTRAFCEVYGVPLANVVHDDFHQLLHSLQSQYEPSQPLRFGPWPNQSRSTPPRPEPLAQLLDLEDTRLVPFSERLRRKKAALRARGITNYARYKAKCRARKRLGLQ